MNKLQEVLEKLRGGEMALENDSALSNLQKAMFIAFHHTVCDEEKKFHYSCKHFGFASSDRNPCSSSITVTEFLALYEQGNDEGKGEGVSEPTDLQIARFIRKLYKDNPVKAATLMVMACGEMCLDANAATLNIKQEMTLQEKRYLVGCKVTIKEI